MEWWVATKINISYDTKAEGKYFSFKNHDKKCKKAYLNKNLYWKKHFCLMQNLSSLRSNPNHWKVFILIFVVSCSVVVLDEQQYQNQGWKQMHFLYQWTTKRTNKNNQPCFGLDSNWENFEMFTAKGCIWKLPLQ